MERATHMPPPAEMQRLVDELSSAEFASAHPILQASYAHYAFVAVHPFADGNGRVARAFASVYLYRAARMPLIVFFDDRPRYFDALAAADSGSYEQFVTFVCDAAIATADVILEALRTVAAPSPHERLDEFRALITVQGGLTHTDLDSVATTLIQNFHRIATEEVSKLAIPNGVNISIGSGGDANPSVPDGYRRVVAGGGQYVFFQLTSAAPSDARRDATFHVFISQTPHADSDLFWIVQEGTGTGILFSLRDVHPLTSAAELRLRMLVERALGTELSDLLETARASLLSSGYAPATDQPARQ